MERIINVPIEDHWLPPYRLEYDGKYIGLYGRDKTYPIWGYGMSEPVPGEYEEMILIPVVLEVRNANPKILEVRETEIVISY
jgi:hypothetical protein